VSFESQAAVGQPAAQPLQLDLDYQYLLEIREEVFTEELRSKGGSLRTESVGGAEPLPEGRRSGDRQWRHEAGQPGHSDWAGQLDVFGSDHGGKTAAVLLSFIATCKRNAVEPFGWFCDVLSRIAYASD